VDGRNPTPVDRWFIHVYAIIYGFNHPLAGAGFRSHPQYQEISGT